MSAIFVTGSGTGIGKTFITAALIHEMRRRGRRIGALKPVVSGFDPARPEASDPAVLLGALGEDLSQDALDRISPWRYAAPLSPDMAARRAARPLPFDTLLSVTQRAIDAAPDVLLIEGVGGVMVPLDDRHTVLDWILALRLPALLVAGSYLGAISHALTAFDALKKCDVLVRALIVNESPDSVALDETIETIARFAGGVPVLGLPRLPSAEATHPSLQRLADLL